ncbi:hypothetical protein Y032_0356g3352 [Ancylostoma ceylanicum]|uniref:Uncharacterized protein n=1 Tax=Ancylostoma ceylanicum TaxID=53326 RepID=A0A016RX99_9BILA|nr:hypothetical protein Y032_0356g3352 [Ancylostoma ceylanicum]
MGPSSIGGLGFWRFPHYCAKVDPSCIVGSVFYLTPHEWSMVYPFPFGGLVFRRFPHYCAKADPYPVNFITTWPKWTCILSFPLLPGQGGSALCRFLHYWTTIDSPSIGDPYSIAFLTNGEWWIHPPSEDSCSGAFLTTAPRRIHPPSSDPCSVVFRSTGPRRIHIPLLEL